jgi:hypothetical protein
MVVLVRNIGIGEWVDLECLTWLGIVVLMMKAYYSLFYLECRDVTFVMVILGAALRGRYDVIWRGGIVRFTVC